MRYLAIALYAEGPSDYHFFRPLLRRVTEELCLNEAEAGVEIADVLGIDIRPTGPDSGSLGRADRIAKAVEQSGEGVDILCVHADAAGDPDSAVVAKIEPARRLIVGRKPEWQGKIVALVPARETEAWALADGEALRIAFGTKLDDATLGLPPKVSAVEALIDPKQTLSDACKVATGRSLRGHHANGLLEILGREVRIPILRQVPAFRRFEEELRGTLRALRYLRGEVSDQ